MKIKDIVKVDSKGRVTIPQAIREAFDIREGMNLLIIADTDEKEIVLSPVPSRAKLVEIFVKIEDRPGVLASVSRTLADHGVDIVFIRCGVIKRGEVGECTIIADISNTALSSLDELSSALNKLEPVKSVEVKII